LEVVRMGEFNINNYVSVRLTDDGHKELKRQHDSLNLQLNGRLGEWKGVKEDADGWSRWQMWDLMNRFGHMLSLGSVMPFDPLIMVGELNGVKG
jgi:hypothetical protein